MKHEIHDARLAVKDPVTGQFGAVVALSGKAWFCVPEGDLTSNPDAYFVETDRWADFRDVEVAIGGKIKTDEKETWFWIQSVQNWEGRGDRCRGLVRTIIPGPWLVKMDPEDVLATDAMRATWFDKVVTSSGALF